MKIFRIKPNLNIKKSLLCFCLLVSCQSVLAKINVFACEPEWMSLLNEIGGDKVNVFSATTGLQDPHQIQARPSLISQIRDADLLVCSGADLEAGWLPMLLRRANNSALQAGQIGHFLAADHVRLLGIPKNIDRSQGDVHAAGNPHVHTSPKNIQLIAKALIQRLQTIDPENSEVYQQQGQSFLARWEIAMLKWKQQIEILSDTKIIAQHASWDYFNQFVKLDQIAVIEEKPGIPATSGHLSSMLKNLKSQPAQVIIHAAYQDGRASLWLGERSGIKVIALPFTVGGSKTALDLFSLFDETFTLLTQAVNTNVKVTEKVKP